jgi:hypothetical protein
MNIGEQLTTKKNALIISYCKGGASCRVAKRGTPWVPVRRAGVFVRNKYRPASNGLTNHFTTSGHQSAYFGNDIQCYGDHRFEPGEAIGEIVDIHDTHLDVILDSKSFDPHLEKPFKVSLGLKIDERLADVFQTLS